MDFTSRFVKCNLEEVDFTESNISSSLFDNCDLKRTVFQETNLEKTDFRTAFNFTIAPEKNRLKGAKFSRSSIDGLLSGLGIKIE